RLCPDPRVSRRFVGSWAESGGRRRGRPPVRPGGAAPQPRVRRPLRPPPRRPPGPPAPAAPGADHHPPPLSRVAFPREPRFTFSTGSRPLGSFFPAGRVAGTSGAPIAKTTRVTRRRAVVKLVSNRNPTSPRGRRGRGTSRGERRRSCPMLTIFGPRSSGFCDRVSRRGFLRVGTFAMGGAVLHLSDLFRP